MTVEVHVHQYKDGYYGHECDCGDFIPYGCEPWVDWEEEDEDDPKYHSLDCTCETCLQNHPERDYDVTCPIPPPQDDSVYYETRQDEDGPYYAIFLFGRLIAYADDEINAQIIVQAIKIANTTALSGLERVFGEMIQ